MKKLLFVNEYGLYPELVKGLQGSGYSVTVEHMMRKAIKFIQKNDPEIVVAEFWHDSQFRDRVGNVESMLAQIEGKHARTRTIILCDPIWKPYLDVMIESYPVDAILMQPVSPDALLQSVAQLSNEK